MGVCVLPSGTRVGRLLGAAHTRVNHRRLVCEPLEFLVVGRYEKQDDESKGRKLPQGSRRPMGGRETAHGGRRYVRVAHASLGLPKTRNVY